MGQKVHPGGFRVGVIHDWKSNWWTSKHQFPEYLLEDVNIRKRTCHVTLVLVEQPEERAPRRRRSQATPATPSDQVSQAAAQETAA